MKSTLKWITWIMAIGFLITAHFIPDLSKQSVFLSIAISFNTLGLFFYYLEYKKDPWISVDKRLPPIPQKRKGYQVIAWWNFNNEFGHCEVVSWNFRPRPSESHYGYSHWKLIKEPDND